jgi:hypothetical protein
MCNAGPNEALKNYAAIAGSNISGLNKITSKCALDTYDVAKHQVEVSYGTESPPIGLDSYDSF